MRHRLIATNNTLMIGKLIVTVDDNGELTRQVKNQKSYSGIKLLVDQNNQPVFHVNAFLLSRRIVDNLKDIEPLAKAMLLYFRFLTTNNMEWDDLDAPLDRNPIFPFRNHLHHLISEGVSIEQVRAIRKLAEKYSVEEIFARIGARNIAQVKRVLEGNTYTRVD